MAQRPPPRWTRWKKRWGWLSAVDSVLSWYERLPSIARGVLRVIPIVIGSGWAWFAENWMPLLLFLLPLAWIGIEIWWHRYQKRVVAEIPSGRHTQIVRGDGSVDATVRPSPIAARVGIPTPQVTGESGPPHGDIAVAYGIVTPPPDPTRDQAEYLDRAQTILQEMGAVVSSGLLQLHASRPVPAKDIYDRVLATLAPFAAKLRAMPPGVWALLSITADLEAQVDSSSVIAVRLWLERMEWVARSRLVTVREARRRVT